MTEQQHHRAKEASHGNATNHDRRDLIRTKVDAGRPARSTVDFGTEVLLDANTNRSPGTQVRSGPNRRDVHRQERGESAHRVVQRRRGTDRGRRVHKARRAQHREKEVETSVAWKGTVMTAEELDWLLQTIQDTA